MQHLGVSGAVRHIYIYIYVIRRLKVKFKASFITFRLKEFKKMQFLKRVNGEKLV